MEDTLSQITESVEDVQRKFYGVTVGRVINQVDPLALGRVQVQLPMLDDVELSPWARVAVPMAGIAHGHYFLPNPGDEVLVGFENGELNAPYVLGSLWNAQAPPPLPSPVPQIRTLRTPIGNTIQFTEVPPSITIFTPQGQTIMMNPAGVQILTHANTINMTPDGVTINAPAINLVGTASINLQAPNVTINGAAATNVQSGGVVNVTGPLVKLN